MVYKAEFELHKAVLDGAFEDEPFATLEKTAGTLGEVKNIADIFWNYAEDNNTVDNTDIMVKVTVTREGEEEPYETQKIVVFSDVVRDEEGNIDLTGSTLSISAYGDPDAEAAEVEIAMKAAEAAKLAEEEAKLAEEAGDIKDAEAADNDAVVADDESATDEVATTSTKSKKKKS